MFNNFKSKFVCLAFLFVLQAQATLFSSVMACLSSCIPIELPSRRIKPNDKQRMTRYLDGQKRIFKKEVQSEDGQYKIVKIRARTFGQLVADSRVLSTSLTRLINGLGVSSAIDGSNKKLQKLNERVPLLAAELRNRGMTQLPIDLERKLGILNNLVGGLV